MDLVFLTAAGVGGATIIGALFGFAFKKISHTFSDIMLSFAAGVMLAAAVMGLIYSFLTVSLRANQNVTGLALTTFGVGVTNYIISQLDFVTFQRGSRFFTASLPFASKLGWFGQIFLSYGFMVYLGIAIAVAASLVLSKTRPSKFFSTFPYGTC